MMTLLYVQDGGVLRGLGGIVDSLATSSLPLC